MYDSIQKGALLTAEPFMLDPYFRRSVVLVAEHTTDGTLGFILNKPLNMALHDLVPDFPEFKTTVLYGGPVGVQSLQYIHCVGELLEGSKKLSSGVYWGGDWSQLKFLIEAKLIEPKHIRFFVGYSGWEAQQLKDEMAEKSWVVHSMHPNYLFNIPTHNLWRTVMQHKGDSYAVIADMPDENNLN